MSPNTEAPGTGPPAAAKDSHLASALQERIEELWALHRTTALFVADGPLEDRFATLVELLPPAMQYPEVCTAAFHHRGETWATPNHHQTPWMLAAPVRSQGTVSLLEVAYLEPRPDVALGPFLIEERALLESIAQIVRSAIDRREAHIELQALLERKNHAFAAAQMGVWELDIAKQTTTWSLQLGRMLGLGEAIRGRLWDHAYLIAPEDRPLVREKVDAITSGAPVQPFEICMRHSNGGYRRMLVSPLVVRDADGRATRIICALQDVTVQRIMEEGLRQAQKVEALGQVAAGVAHDFNNLLTVMMANACWLESELPEGPLRNAAQEILETSERAASLTQQLLSFSRKTEFSPAWLNLADTVRRLEPILRRVVQPGRSLVVECNEEGGLVWIDPSQLEQVILNLVVNAHDAISEGGRIAVRTRRMIAEDGNTQAELEVSDTGSGIPPEVLEKIFEPFFTTKENGKGTGLGLAVVMSVARRWQGSVEVDSTVGVGTTFRVRLPLGDPRNAPSTAPA